MTSGLTGPRQPSWLRAAPRAVEVLMVIVLAWILAEALWFSLYGTDHRRLDAPPAAPRAMDVGTRLADAASLDGLFAARGRTNIAADAPAPESRLNFRLRGVRVESDDRSSVAIIEVPGQGQRLLRVGDEVSPGIVLTSVTTTHVIINRRGAREAIYLREEARRDARAAAASGPVTASPASSPASPSAASSGSSSSAPSGAAASGGPSPLTGAPVPEIAARLETEDWVDGLRLEPVLQGGALEGLRVRDNTRLEVLRGSGLLPGDVIRSVNGTRLDGAEAARAVAETFETAGEARLEIERDGAPVTLTIPLNRGG